MDYALKERIGKPELFTGRKQELAYFLKWINDIKDSHYKGIKDNIFDKVFRGVYEEDIRNFSPEVIREEYNTELKEEKKRYKILFGKYNCTAKRLSCRIFDPGSIIASAQE